MSSKPHSLNDLTDRAEDSDLLARLGAKDEHALATLHDRYSQLVYSIALSILGDHGTAEDVSQDIWMQLWVKPLAFDFQRGRLAGWFTTTTRNRSIDRLRMRRPLEPLDELCLSSSSDLFSVATQFLLMDKVRVYALELPSEQLTALEMAFFEGLTHSEISCQTGIPLGTVKTRIRDGIKRLGSLLAQDSSPMPWSPLSQ